MNKHLVIPALILVLTACSTTPTVVPLSPTTNSNNPPAIPATAAPQESTPTIVVQQPPTVASTSEPSGTLWLQILSPQDESVINSPQVDVIGSAPAGVVISISDDILLVGDDLQFKTTITLDEGPNLVEIVASDDHGNETSLLWTLIYEP